MDEDMCVCQQRSRPLLEICSLPPDIEIDGSFNDTLIKDLSDGNSILLQILDRLRKANSTLISLNN